MTTFARTAPSTATDEIWEHRPPRRRFGGSGLSLNLTAMIDVVFLLLVYFMVGTEFKLGEEVFRLDLPDRQPSMAQARIGGALFDQRAARRQQAIDRGQPRCDGRGGIRGRDALAGHRVRRRLDRVARGMRIDVRLEHLREPVLGQPAQERFDVELVVERLRVGRTGDERGRDHRKQTDCRMSADVHRGLANVTLVYAARAAALYASIACSHRAVRDGSMTMGWSTSNSPPATSERICRSSRSSYRSSNVRGWPNGPSTLIA
jgi:hypothetical protein